MSLNTELTSIKSRLQNVLDGCNDVFVSKGVPEVETLAGIASNIDNSLSSGLEGSLYPNNGDVSASIDGLTTTSITIPAGITSGGNVSLTDDIENAIDEISGVEDAVLPDGYTQVEYIQSSGTQYIDTGVIPNQDTRVVLDVVFTNETTSWLFGSRTSANVNCFGFLNTGDLKYRADYNTTTAELSVQKTDRFVLDMNKNVLSFDGETIYTFTYASFQGVYSMLLFGANTGGSVSVGSATTTVYACQIYDNGTLVRDFVPCVNSSGAAGLYDLVNGFFYPDAAGGTFEAGGEVTVKEGLGISSSLGALEAVSGDISAALAEKGVEVPDGMTLSEVAGLIGQISGAQVAEGTISGTGTSTAIEVTGLGFTPSRVCVVIPESSYWTYQDSSYYNFYWIDSNSPTGLQGVYLKNTANAVNCTRGTVTDLSGYFTLTITDDGFSLNSNNESYYYIGSANAQLKCWTAWG